MKKNAENKISQLTTDGTLDTKKMVALNPDKLIDAAKKVKINRDNLAVINGEVMNDDLSAMTTSEYVTSSGFLRYVMKQMFTMLDYQGHITKDYYGNDVKSNGYNAFMRNNMSYTRQFTFLLGSFTPGQNHGFLHQMHMKEKENDGTLKFYEMAWGREQICRMLDQYVEDVCKYLDFKAHKNCGEVRYINTKNYHYGSYGKVLAEKLHEAVETRINKRKERIMACKNYEEVRLQIKRFLVQDYIKIGGSENGNINNRQFLASYKLFGAYWTMHNLIGWHGCVIHLDDRTLTRQESISWLNENIFTMEGYEALACLKKLIVDNNYSFDNDPYITQYYENRDTETKKTA